MKHPTRIFALLLTVSCIGSCGDDSPPEEQMGDEFPPATSGTIYSYANGCFSIGVIGTGKYLAASDSGDEFQISASSLQSASRFRVRPSDLGTYLLFDENEQYLVSEDGETLERRSELLSDAQVIGGEVTIDDGFVSEGEWELQQSRPGGEIFRLQHRRSGKYLTEQGSVGDSVAKIFLFEQSDCATFPELSVDAEGEVSPVEFDDGSVFGFVETHAHLFSNFGFGGGGIFHGAPYHRLGVEHALPSCEPFHGEEGRQDLLGFAFGDLGGLGPETLLNLFLTRTAPVTHETTGYPDFSAWPDAYQSSTHQVQYYKWVERAYLSGLRLMVQHATTNHVLCELLVGLGTQPARYGCNDMVAVDRIIDETYALERYIDAQHGGPGEGWFRVVTSPEEARGVIGDGKLAVVLGIETSILFDCFLVPPDGFSKCTEADVLAKLDEYHDKGVRVLFPVHKFDNAFSAGDGHRGIIDLGNFIQTGHWTNYALCEDLGVADVPPNFDHGNVPLGGLNMPRDAFDSEPPLDFSGFSSDPLAALLGGVPDLIDVLGEPALEGDYCQRTGLTELGEFLIDEMMRRGMVLEVDHMPRLSRKRALEILVENDYPAVGSHGNNHDGLLYELGGVSKFNFGRCRSESTPATLDDGFQNRIQLMRDRGAFAAEGFGFDFNGFAGAPRPRFGENANCADPQSDPITYPFTSYAGDVTFTEPVVGKRTIDFNTEGMAHLGLVAELIEEVRRDGVTDEDLEPLFKSAEGYLRMWEKSERRGQEISGDP